jgi:hypothetical protein
MTSPLYKENDICTAGDCPDRQKTFYVDPYCQFGTDNGWIEDECGEPIKVFLHPCDWKRLTEGCPRGFR